MSYVSKNNFDWEYYYKNNQDVQKAGLNTLDKCYNHWIRHGCREHRQIKQLTTTSSTKSLPFKMAIMIHIYDVKMIHFFSCYLTALYSTYNSSDIDVYVNIVDMGYTDDAKKSHRELFNLSEIKIYYFPNKGGDIGGFLLLSKQVVESQIDYRYVIFVHSKKKKEWRIELCKHIFNIVFEKLSNTSNIGLISAGKWIYSFDPKKQPDEYNKFKYHLIDLCRVYQLNDQQKWDFVAGTMFLTNIKILQYIVSHDFNYVYNKLNDATSVDSNWLSIIRSQNKNNMMTYNDYQYRQKFGKSILSDYMFEHTFERVIGLICQHLGLLITS